MAAGAGRLSLAATERQFETQKAGAAADVERFASWEGQIWDTVPGGALGRGADAMAEILVEMHRLSVPMSGELLFDRVGLFPTD